MLYVHVAGGLFGPVEKKRRRWRSTDSVLDRPATRSPQSPPTRTAHINGTEGTDHGTGTVALLVGGALRGGRIVADWSGLKPADLYENRDLAATTDLRAVLKGVLRDHLRADERALAETVFPGSG